MVPVKELTERVHHSIKQMMARLTAKNEKYNKLLKQTDDNIKYLNSHYDWEKRKFEAIRDKQVSGLSPQAIIS